MRRAFTTLDTMGVIAGVFGVLVLVAIIIPIFGRRKEGPHRASCQSNMKQIALGAMQYVQDYDGSYPRASSKQGGWLDVLQPYLRSTQIFQCPSETSGAKQGTTDYFYNARLVATTRASGTKTNFTILNGDGPGESPSNYSLSALPPAWASDSNSPAWRHKEGANYSFADAHVKWLKPDKITNNPTASQLPTFAVK